MGIEHTRPAYDRHLKTITDLITNDLVPALENTESVPGVKITSVSEKFHPDLFNRIEFTVEGEKFAISLFRPGPAEMTDEHLRGSTAEEAEAREIPGVKSNSPADEYLHTVDRIEPDIHPLDRDGSVASIAISLKRIADTLAGGDLHLNITVPQETKDDLRHLAWECGDSFKRGNS